MAAADILSRLWAEAGMQTPPPVSFVGADPIFPLPFPVGEAGAAVIGACAAMAAELWRMHTGRSQEVRVEVDAAAAAMRSNQYLQVGSEGEQTASISALNQDIYLARDGRSVYLHRGFVHHRARIAAVLDGATDPVDLAAAVGRRTSFAVEEAVVRAGACAGVVRTRSEWLAHEQGTAVRQLPLFEVQRVGESAPEPLHAGDRPLSGVRVLDLTRVLAGPTCARTLAEHGADVLRIGTTRLPNNDNQTIDTGHGKRSTVLDLTAPEGSATLRELAKGADVFSQGYRPGSLARRGFGSDELMTLRPGIIAVQLSAFGHVGPWSGRRGFDTLVQVVSGITDEYAEGGPPRLLPVSVLDYCTGYLAAFGVMVALARRAREGGSYLVRVSLAQTARWLDELGRIPAEVVASAPPELPAARIGELSIAADTAFGPIRFLAPVAHLSETPARWERPAVPLDHDVPAWL